jgi:hypothetical protein
MAFDPYISIPVPKPGKPTPGKPTEVESFSPGVAPPVEQTVPLEKTLEKKTEE